MAAAFDFLKSDGTDRHLGNCTANLYMQFNLKVHLSYFFCNSYFEIMWHIIILIIICLVIVVKNGSNTNTEIMQLLFVVDTYLDAPIL